MSKIAEKGLHAYCVEEFKAKTQEEDAVILDTRKATLFSQGFIPGSISIGSEGKFNDWASALLPSDKAILLITDTGKEGATATQLNELGFNNVIGYLNGGFEAWEKSKEPIDMIVDVEADELMMDIPFDQNLLIIDVRKPTEFADGHLKDAVNIPLSELKDPGSMANIKESDNLYIHCAAGYRSVIASSLLKRQGIHNLRNVLGGWERIKEEEKAVIVKEPNLLN